MPRALEPARRSTCPDKCRLPGARRPVKGVARPRSAAEGLTRRARQAELGAFGAGRTTGRPPLAGRVAPGFFSCISNVTRRDSGAVRVPGRCPCWVLGAGGPVAAGGARPALAGGGPSGSGGRSGAPDRGEAARVELVVTGSGGGRDGDVVEDGGDDRVLPGQRQRLPALP